MAELAKFCATFTAIFVNLVTFLCRFTYFQRSLHLDLYIYVAWSLDKGQAKEALYSWS